MVLALATGNKIALAGMAAIFIGFALVSAFVLPKRDPNFPGRSLGWYVLTTVVLFVAMMTTVLVFGKEKGEERAQAETPAATETGASAELPSSPTGSTKTETAGGGGAATGNPAAGKKVFTSAGCAGCHTLKAAGATGTVGPNLDEAKPDESLIRARVEHGKGAMPAFGDSGQLSKKQIDDVVAFVYRSTHS
jgi:mono/diheme cytochrome c family protein